MRVGSVGVAFLLSASLLSGVASAHVSSSETTNNRYYKLTPMSDRVRLAYTIFFGSEPSLVTRRQMDVDHDGVLSGQEVTAYGQRIADELFASVSFLQSGQEAEILWQDIDVGMDDFTVGGGAFSVDFIGTVCLEHQGLGSVHELLFRDRMRLPSSGESELSMAPAPGIRLTETTLDGRPAGDIEKWQGGPGPAQTGYGFRFVVDTQDMAVLDKSCAPAKDESRALWPWTLVGALGGVTLLGFALFFWRARTR